MSTPLSAKTTVYLEPVVKKFIQHRAIAEDRSVSELINDYLADMIEDLSDIKDIEYRRQEPTDSLEHILKDLNLTYDDLRG